MRKLKTFAAALAAAGLISGAAVTTRVSRADTPKPAAVWKTAVTPKALSANTRRGLDWLAKHQLGNGAWGQGDEAVGMGGGTELRDASSVADTSMALLAFLRAGHDGRTGDYQANAAVARGGRFLAAAQGADGAIRSPTYPAFKDGYSLTPLALAAMFAVPDEPAVAAAYPRGVDFLATIVGADGRLRDDLQAPQYPLYSIAIGTISLSADAHTRVPDAHTRVPDAHTRAQGRAIGAAHLC